MVVDEKKIRDSTIEVVSTELKPILLIKSEIHLLASITTSIIEMPIVIIESTLGKYVRPFLPAVRQGPDKTIIYLAHNTKDDLYYNTRDTGKCII